MIYGHDDNAMTELQRYTKQRMVGYWNSTIKALKKMLESGTYTPKKGERLFLKLYTRAAIQNCKEYGLSARTVYPMYKREFVAKLAAKAECEQLVNG